MTFKGHLGHCKPTDGQNGKLPLKHSSDIQWPVAANSCASANISVTVQDVSTECY